MAQLPDYPTMATFGDFLVIPTRSGLLINGHYYLNRPEAEEFHAALGQWLAGGEFDGTADSEGEGARVLAALEADALRTAIEDGNLVWIACPDCEGDGSDGCDTCKTTGQLLVVSSRGSAKWNLLVSLPGVHS